MRNWNVNGCVRLVKAAEAPLVIVAPALTETAWAGTVLRYPDTPVQVVVINASTLGEPFGDFHKQSALCHELGHALGIVEHSTDPASCMSWTWTSAAPSLSDLDAPAGALPVSALFDPRFLRGQQHRPLPLSSLRERALQAMRARGVVGILVGDSPVCQQDVRGSDEIAAAVLRKLNEEAS